MRRLAWSLIGAATFSFTVALTRPGPSALTAVGVLALTFGLIALSEVDLRERERR